MMYPYDVYDLVITVDVLQHPSRAEQLQFFALLLTLIQHLLYNFSIWTQIAQSCQRTLLKSLVRFHKISSELLKID